MTSRQSEMRGKFDKGLVASGKVVVAVKGSKNISKTALVWALTHVVQPGDCITLLVVLPPLSSGRKLRGFPIFSGGCASAQKKSQSIVTTKRSNITDSCSQMILQLDDSSKVNIKMKIVSGSPCGAVATESLRIHASWVILDEQLKNEKKHCIEELLCNIVVMKHSQPEILRLNLLGSPKTKMQIPRHLPSNMDSSYRITQEDIADRQVSIQRPDATPASSSDALTSFSETEAGTISLSNSDPEDSLFLVSDLNISIENECDRKKGQDVCNVEVSSSDFESRRVASITTDLQPWMAEILGNYCSSPMGIQELPRKSESIVPKEKTFLEKFENLNFGSEVDSVTCSQELKFSQNVRVAMSLSRNSPLLSPPLCSICRHKAPVFGKPPRWFSYSELELATGGFSQSNFLAEGGFGSVHRGVLPDGRSVAVKQHKFASFQGDQEFCSEVEVLSCAQHRNVVMLIGLCVEGKRRLLVYEYICNGSLDSHLYGRTREQLEWSARQKIALGAARGLRYLHEECRVGCIVHRDMRPNNILLTHDFEPLVGDFGLARWQPYGELGVETRVIGTLGYLAPEYAQSGQLTEKADVYSFGVVLLELVTGRKAVDINRPKGQQCLTEWARPLLEKLAIEELVDPCLRNKYIMQEVHSMLQAASLCIRHDPHARPRMSQVLRIIDGRNMIVDVSHGSSTRYERGKNK